MKIVLVKDVPQIGQRGAVLDVKDGFGRNFLIPRGLARVADAGTIKEFEFAKLWRQEKAETMEKAMGESAARLGETELHFKRKANDQGHLFAAVSRDDICESLHRIGFSLIHKEHIEGAPIKSTGEHVLHINFDKKLVPMRIIITSQ